ncbi:MAG: DUF3126 family protein [Rickettsiales bacterium]|jgi:hypothetical protein|nr:DUF3126 family protein [Rickettsiales bacterium]
MRADDMRKVERFLNEKFAKGAITLKSGKADDDMAEAYIDGEFVGTVYRDDEENEVSFDFNMTILDIDLK